MAFITVVSLRDDGDYDVLAAFNGDIDDDALDQAEQYIAKADSDDLSIINVEVLTSVIEG